MPVVADGQNGSEAAWCSEHQGLSGPRQAALAAAASSWSKLEVASLFFHIIQGHMKISAQLGKAGA